MPQKGFFASLFDFSFTSLITTRIIKILYVVFVVLFALLAIGFVISAFARNTTTGVLTLLVFAPIGFLLYTIYTRVVLEVVIVLFRIMENTGQLVVQGGGTPSAIGGGGAQPAAPAGSAPAAVQAPPPTQVTPPPPEQPGGPAAPPSYS